MYNAMSNLSLTHSFFSSPSLFFRSLSSRIAILELNSARCVTTQLLCHLQGLIEDTRRRCRLSHRASSISILTSGSFHSCRLHIEERSRKQAIAFDRCLFSYRSHFSLSFSSSILPPFSLSLSLSLFRFLDHKCIQSYTSQTRSRSLAFVP